MSIMIFILRKDVIKRVKETNEVDAVLIGNVEVARGMIFFFKKNKKLHVFIQSFYVIMTNCVIEKKFFNLNIRTILQI